MLETPRLRLIPIAAEHFDSLAAMYADPEVSRFLHGEPLDRAESWRRLALNLGHWILRGYGNFACIEKTSGTFRSEEHTSELQSQSNLVCRLLLEKKKQHQCHITLTC